MSRTTSGWARVAWQVVRFAVAAGLVAFLISRASLTALSFESLRWEWVGLAVVLVPLSIWVRAYDLGLLLNRESKLLTSGQL